MRADRLDRRSYLKRGAVKPLGEITLYDMTAAIGLRGETRPLAEAGRELPERAHEEIAALPYRFETVGDVMAWAVAALGESPVGAALWREAADDGWSAGLADLKNGGFYIDVPAREILLDHFALTCSALGRSTYFRNTMLLAFVRALREVAHETRFGAPEEKYNPEDVLMVERVRAADADTISVLVGWELRGAGHADIWRHLIGSPEGDMALIFTRFLERDPSALFSGAALAYAFRQWYADENRVGAVDHDTLEALDDVLMAQDNLPAAKAGLLGPAAIEDFSVLPGGVRYLAGLGDTILHDSFFAGLHDPINQTHLFHILYDMEVIMVNNVPFRDPGLVRRIFPHSGLALPPPVSSGAAE